MRFSSFILPTVAIFTKPSKAQPQSLNTTNNHDISESSSISLDLFNKILATEVRTEIDLSILMVEEANDMWNEAILHQWTVAEEREEFASVNDQRRAILGLLPPGLSPFLVCDLTYGKSGDACKRTVEEALGSKQLMPLYNKFDATCFAVGAMASEIKSLPDNVEGIPFTPEMKIASGLIDMIGNADSAVVTRIEAGFCLGETNSSDTATQLTTLVLEDISSTGADRQRRVQSFLDSRSMLQERREPFWHRLLSTINEDACLGMFLDLNVAVTKDVAVFTFHDSPKEMGWPVECIQALVIDLALQPEFCFVDGFQPMQTYNILASGIVQSGSSGSKPFYDSGINGTGQVVGLSDTGIDLDNCYFYDGVNAVPKSDIGATTGPVNMKARKVVQYVSYADGSDRENGHGTHVAGSLVGRKSSNGSTESDGEADGVARGAKLAMFDIGTSAGDLSVPNLETIFSAQHQPAGANIHSASWGSDRNSYSSLDRIADKFMYENPDFLFIVAAGNAGNKGQENKKNTVGTPAICKNGISVGASQNAKPHLHASRQGPDYLADFSSRGPTADGRRKPDVVAPGKSVHSARANPAFTGECDDTASPGIISKSGTSMAAPVTAGSAAMVRQYFEEGWHITGQRNTSQGFNPTASLVKAVLLNGASAIVGVDNEATQSILASNLYDIHQGYGRVNLLNSLPLAVKNKMRALFVNSKSMRTGNRDYYEVVIDTSSGCDEPLSVTLVWTDPPGGASCHGSCVLNDLDLTLHGNEKVFYPNGLVSGPDTMNNAERVIIDKPTNGATYSIRVFGSNLLDDQDYSLVATGCLKDDEAGCGGEKSIPPPFLGTLKWYGVIFDLKAKNRLRINSFDLHLAAKQQYQVEIYSKPGQAKDSPQGSGGWTEMCKSQVQGQGFKSTTVIPSKDCGPVEIDDDQFQTFYVTLVGIDDMVVARANVTAGTENADLMIRPGSAVTYFDTVRYDKFVFDGGVRYNLL